MKRNLPIIISGLLLSFASVSMADNTTPTPMDKNWTCSTNASSSDVAADQDADKQMDNTPKSAADAFAFAAKNCRDCTKITCESDND
ncbi:hypothetical protein [Legionella genomosp. 1]|uniref:hypothetical protein n=1 Tax=Legionella genomosp. 1 TaxID=1093625 RepID=UPI0016512E70|nr:hypothetical protein [Legionella genomosp. 1]